ncbi:MAG TPA: hydrogenase maturation peptidase HycI [Methanocorpusculum sp.]|nr:hydrogenase maturation peptidase HycI [Methanocorpusculum sp.]
MSSDFVSSPDISYQFVLLGIGNTLHADDGAGPYLADLISEEHNPAAAAFNCGTAPENFTGVVRKLHPHHLIIADAALMNEKPGTLRRIPADKIRETAVGTHMLALSHLVRYLENAADNITLIGIQPESLEDRDNLSPDVAGAVRNLKDICLSGRFEEIPLMQ